MTPDSQGTCPRGRCMSPVNPVQIGRLLPGVTPGVFDFRGRVKKPSRLLPAPGTWQAPTVTTPGPPLTCPTMPHDHRPLPAF